jgi:hypothetical protein
MEKREKVNKTALNDCRQASDEKLLRPLDRRKRDMVKIDEGYKN